jgi:chromosome segregation ATPase
VTNGDLAELRALLERRFDLVDQRFDAIDQRFVAIDERFVAIDQRFVAIDQRFDAVDRRLDAVDRRFDRIDERLDGFDRQFTVAAVRFDVVERALHEGFAGVNRRFGELTAHFDRAYGWLEKLEQERLVTNALLTRLDRRQDELSTRLDVLDRRQAETTEALVHVAGTLTVMNGTLQRLTEQQAFTSEALRRLEARG